MKRLVEESSSDLASIDDDTKTNKKPKPDLQDPNQEPNDNSSAISSDLYQALRRDPPAPISSSRPRRVSSPPLAIPLAIIQTIFLCCCFRVVIDVALSSVAGTGSFGKIGGDGGGEKAVGEG
ncbi:hypothetical protein Vadar_002121 [Vaccinium darrowii]|uniref:Uncharacterized protein n=1 Tax=Vaccinium darrowii TaxID=229202 RepID=A0ACB7XMP5_9ERIC|nr:hypothetical protein Vadar_002121 [Vaccinium darrowii]